MGLLRLHFPPLGWCFCVLESRNLHPVGQNNAMANPNLNDREMEILRLIGEGCTSAQIAATLSLSSETIKWYRKKLLVKFDADNTAVLIRKAATAGLI